MSIKFSKKNTKKTQKNTKKTQKNAKKHKKIQKKYKNKGGNPQILVIFMNFKFLTPEIIKTEDSTEYVFSYEHFNKASEMLLEYYNKTQTDKITDAGLMLKPYKEEDIISIVKYCIKESFSSIIEESSTFMSTTDNPAVSELLDNAWDSNLMFCNNKTNEDSGIQCLKQRYIKVKLYLSIDGSPRLEVINNGLMFKFPEKEKEYTYTDLTRFHSKNNMNEKNKKESIGFFHILGGFHAGLKGINNSTDLSLSFKNTTNNESCVILTKKS